MYLGSPFPLTATGWWACVGRGQFRGNLSLLQNKAQDINWLEAGLMFQAAGNLQGWACLGRQEQELNRAVLSLSSRDPILISMPTGPSLERSPEGRTEIPLVPGPALSTHMSPLMSACMGHWLPDHTVVQSLHGMAPHRDLLVIKPWVNILQTGSLLMTRKGFGRWEPHGSGPSGPALWAFTSTSLYAWLLQGCQGLSWLITTSYECSSALSVVSFPRRHGNTLDCWSCLVWVWWLSRGAHASSLEVCRMQSTGRVYGEISQPWGEHHISRTPWS